MKTNSTEPTLDAHHGHRKKPNLQDSEAFYYSLVENIPQFIFCKDMEGRFTFVNQLFCGLLERPLHDIIGKTDYDFFPEELAKKYREDDMRVIREGRVLEDVEENKISHRETKYVHVLKTPIHDSEGRIIGIQGIFWDITDRKKAEEELKNANERMKQDLIAAAKVQRGFIPEHPPEIPGYRFAWLFEPSEYVGGDILNVIRLDEKHWAFYVLDVSGHGVPAALLSVSLTRMIDQMCVSLSGDNAKAASVRTPKDLFDPRHVVRMLSQRFPGDPSKFCTLVYAILDTEEGSLTWVRAGHLAPLLVRQHGKGAEYLHDPVSPCISTLTANDGLIETRRIVLKPGDRFIVFSDGITEAMRDHQEFSDERLAKVMRATASLELELSLKALIHEIREWTGSKKFMDDVSVLVLERT